MNNDKYYNKYSYFYHNILTLNKSLREKKRINEWNKKLNSQYVNNHFFLLWIKYYL